MRIAVLGYHGSIHTRRWVAHLAGHGHDVHVVTCGDGPTGGDRPDAGYSVHDLGPPRAGRIGYLAKLGAARRTIRELDPEVVHVHYATSYGLLGLASGARPMVVTAHGDDLLIAPRNPVMGRLVSRVLRSASLITVPAEHMKEAAERLLRGRRRRIQVFQYGVETGRLVALSGAARPPAPGPLRIVSVRPLMDLYRIDVLLSAISLLERRGVDCVCDVVGTGPALGELRGLARRLGIEQRVIFHGQLPEAEVEPALAAADVYVSVAESDGASLALLEALALGAVPVVSDIEANRSWVTDGWNGVLVEISPEPLARGIERAAALAASDVAERNHRLVVQRADRQSNLDAFERSLRELVAAD
jgi:glycosyltransferase involved in cell wall biosynthesis